MNEVFWVNLQHFVINYINDILIYTGTMLNIKKAMQKLCKSYESCKSYENTCFRVYPQVTIHSTMGRQK